MGFVAHGGVFSRGERPFCDCLRRRSWYLPVNWIDITLLVVLGLFSLRGFYRGLFREVFSVVGMGAGLLAAMTYHEPATQWLGVYWELSPFVLKVAAFVVVFFIVYFACSLAGWLLHRSEGALFLKTFNRAGGVAVGLGKGLTVVALLLYAVHSATWLPQPTRDKMAGAYLVAPLFQLATGIIHFSKDKLSTEQARPDARVMLGRILS